MKRAYLYLHLAVLLAGFTGIFGRLIALNQIVLVFYRTLLASVILGLILLFSKNKPHYAIKNRLHMAATGLVITLHWIFFYASIKTSNVSIGVVCFCLTGFFTSLLGPLVSHRKFDKYELLLSLLVLLGIVLIFSFDTIYRFGIFLGIISAFLASLFTLLNERLIEKQLDVWTINFYQLFAGAIFSLFVFCIFKYIDPSLVVLPNRREWMYLSLLALFCTVILYSLVLTAQRYVAAFTINLSFNLEPIYSIVLAVLLFHENKFLTTSFYIGCSLILVSISIQMWRLNKMEKRKNLNIAL